MNFIPWCATLATFPARYTIYRIGKALGQRELGLRIASAGTRPSVQMDEWERR